VEVAREEGASIIAHGCTGKGNDQVRIEVGINSLAPDIKILAPAREWGMTREETIEYAKQNKIPVPITTEIPYSIDENLWGRSAECGVPGHEVAVGRGSFVVANRCVHREVRAREARPGGPGGRIRAASLGSLVPYPLTNRPGSAIMAPIVTTRVSRKERP